MKKAVYILTVILAAAGVAYYITELINVIKLDKSMIVIQLITYSFYISAVLCLGVLSLLQLKKTTPRVMLILSGISVFNSFILLFNNNFYGLILLAVGLLPSLYMLIHYSLLVKNEPKSKEKYSSILTAAGVISCLLIPVTIMAMINNAWRYEAIPDAKISFICYSILTAVRFISLTFFCLLKNRRTSVLYRMFLLGQSVYSVFLIITLDITGLVSSLFSPIFFFWDTAGSALTSAMVLILLIHAFKTRYDGILPYESAPLPPQQTEMPSV